MSLISRSIIDTWRIESLNWDSAIGMEVAREHLIELSKDRFNGHEWQKAISERFEEFPKFFELYNYDWCREQDAFDFPIEASLQVRAVDAAIGMWLANISDKPINPNLANIVARSTYLAKFKEVTPHVRKMENGIAFLISPLGWLEFIHRYFAGFNAYLGIERSSGKEKREHCHGPWRSIAANLIASEVNRMDYFLPVMIDKIIDNVPEFTGADGDFREVSETDLSRDFAYAAHDFAICHEIAHIVADDFDLPDEERADRWGVAAYFGSWGRRPALHLDICRNDALRASVGPFVFSCAVRALLAARAAVSSRLDNGESHTLNAHYSTMGNRSRLLWAKTIEFQQAFVPEKDTDVYQKELAQLESVLSHLLDYEVAFADFLKKLNPESCRLAAKAAIAAETEALASD